MNSSCSNVYALPVFYLANMRQENDKKNVLRKESNLSESNICHYLSKPGNLTHSSRQLHVQN